MKGIFKKEFRSKLEVRNKKIYSYIIDNRLQIEQIMKEYTNYIYTIVKNSYIQFSNEDIEEITLDVFLTIWKNKNKLDINKNMSAYICGITRNLIKKKNRNAKINDNIEDYQEQLIDLTNIELFFSETEKKKIIIKELEKMKQEDYESYSSREYTSISENLNRSNVIASDNYMIYMDDRGRGFSKYKDILVNKFKENADYEQGIFFYIKNIKTKKIWSNAILASNKPDKCKITFSSDSNKIQATYGNIETKTKVLLVPNENIEIRNLSLKNDGPLEEMLEVSSYLEPILSTKQQEEAHPAFNNLFLKYSLQEENEIIEIQRRQRNKGEKQVYLAASFYTEDETVRRT